MRRLDPVVTIHPSAGVKSATTPRQRRRRRGSKRGSIPSGIPTPSSASESDNEGWNQRGKVFGGDVIDFFFVDYTKDVGSAVAGFPAMRPPGCPARWPLLSAGKGRNRTRCSGEVPVGEARMRARLPVAPPTPTQCVPTR